MRKLTIIFLIALILVSTFVIAQAIGFPSSFRMGLNNLPAQQGPNEAPHPKRFV